MKVNQTGVNSVALTSGSVVLSHTFVVSGRSSLLYRVLLVVGLEFVVSSSKLQQAQSTRVTEGQNSESNKHKTTCCSNHHSSHLLRIISCCCNIMMTGDFNGIACLMENVYKDISEIQRWSTNRNLTLFVNRNPFILFLNLSLDLLCQTQLQSFNELHKRKQGYNWLNTAKWIFFASQTTNSFLFALIFGIE